MNIENFKSVVTAIARPTLFYVTVTGAPIQSVSSQPFRFTCKAASIPGSTFGVIEVPYMGRKIKFPGDRTYSEWQTTLIADNEWTTYREIYKWHEGINHPYENVASRSSVNDMKGQASIHMRDNSNRETLVVKLIGFYPQEIQQLDVAWDQTDTTADLMITWQYDYVLLEGTSVSSGTYNNVYN